MKKGLTFLMLAILIVTSFAFVGCTPKEAEKKVIGVSLFYRRDEYYKDQETGIRDEAEKLGYELLVVDADTDPLKQTAQIEDFMTKGVDLVLFSPCDVSGLVPVTKTLNEKKIPVVLINSPLTGVKVDSLIQVDYGGLGQTAAVNALKYVDAKLGGTAKIAVLEYPQSAIVCCAMVAAFEAEVAKHPGVEIVAKQDGKASREGSMQAMENILQAQPQIDLVFGINADTCLGALAAIQAANRKDAKVIALGWSSEIFKMVEDGDFDFVVCFNPYKAGQEAVKAADVVLKGQTPAERIIVPSEFYDRESLKNFDWRAIMAKRGD